MTNSFDLMIENLKETNVLEQKYHNFTDSDSSKEENDEGSDVNHKSSYVEIEQP